MLLEGASISQIDKGSGATSYLHLGAGISPRTDGLGAALPLYPGLNTRTLDKPALSVHPCRVVLVKPRYHLLELVPVTLVAILPTLPGVS